MTTTSREEQASRSRHVVADQSEVLAFLSQPSSYGPGVTEVQRIDTHASIVFLAGDRVYKVKRAVKFPYMDYSTLALRQGFCLRELEINRRTARQLYLDVVPIVRAAGGGLALGGEGRAVEWAVVMRRFEQADLFDRMAQTGRLTPELMRELSQEVLAFHGAAARHTKGTTSSAGADGLSDALEETLAEFVERPDLFAPEVVEALSGEARTRLARVAELLEARLAAGYLRDCHGDLHLRNICLFAGRPTLFDAIEFNAAFSRIDTLYDLAFLLMDLDHHGLRGFGNLVLNHYLKDGKQLSALVALPLFLALRAAIRAKVCASAEASQDTPAGRQAMQSLAQGYFAQAAGYLDPPPAALVAVGGLSGSGKSTLAARLAPHVGAAPGAIHLRSDVLRKGLFGVGEEVRLGPEAYTPEVSREVYREMLQRARAVLAAGHSVILDAVYSLPASRERVERLAQDLRVPFVGLWLEAPERELMARVATRRHDASDATPEVVRRQSGEDLGTIAWHRIDAFHAPEAVQAAAMMVAKVKATEG